MSQFENLAKTAADLNAQHGDKIEGPSDQVLDALSAKADEMTGGRFGDQIGQGREAADRAVGTGEAAKGDAPA